jgi:hypothetical protein
MKLFLFDFHKLVYYSQYEKPVVPHNRTSHSRRRFVISTVNYVNKQEMLIQENRTSEYAEGYFLLSAAPLHWLENTHTPY